MPDISAFESDVHNRTSRAAQMRQCLLLPILDANGNFRTALTKEELNATFKAASRDSVYEAAGDQAPMIMGIHARALKNYIERHDGALPLKRRHIMVLHDHNVVAADNGSASVMGAFRLGEEMINVTGTVDYATGKVDVTFSKAPAAGIEVHIGYDVDIEKDPTLIPRIDHEMESRTLYPHEAAIAGDSTIQAQWGLRREYGLDIDNMTLAGMRNLLSADKDRKILRQMLFYAKGCTEWCYEGPESLTLQEHYETLKAALLEIDTRLTQQTGVVGLTGIVGDTQSVNIFRYLPSPFFTPAPGYRPLPQPHYVGKVFGLYDLYCNPSQEPFTSLCYAKGSEHGQTGFVAGDAVPAITFRHPVLTDLMSRSTLWELSYRNLQPFDGREYLTTLKMIPKAGA